MAGGVARSAGAFRRAGARRGPGDGPAGDAVRGGVQARGPYGRVDRPERPGPGPGLSGVHGQPAVPGQRTGREAVELLRVELGAGGAARVGQVGDHDVVRAAVPGRAALPQPLEHITRDHPDPRVVQRVPVERGQARVRTGQAGQVRVEFDDGHGRDAGVAQDLAGGEAVAAAEHQDPAVRSARHGRVHQPFMVRVVVFRAGPQAAVKVEAEWSAASGTVLRRVRCGACCPVAAGPVEVLVRGPGPARGVRARGGRARTARDHDFLDAGTDRDPRRRPVHRVPRGALEGRHQDHPGGEQRQHQHVRGDQGPAGPYGQVAAEEPEHQPAAGHRVDRTGEQGAGDLAQPRKQQEGEGESADQGAHVVGREQVRHRTPRVLAADPLDERHQQRHLGPDEHAHGQREGDQDGAGLAEPGVAGVERHRGEAADEREDRLQRAEADGRPAAEPFGEQ